MSAIANDNNRKPTLYVPQYDTFIGDKASASRDLSTTQIAALIRADIKAAQKSGQLAKDLKVSVRSEYFSMGSSITVKVTAAPFAILSDEALESARDPNAWMNKVERYTAVAKATIDLLDDMAMAYNHTVTEMQTDYFQKRYYAHVDFDSDLESAESAAYVAHFGKVR